MLRIRPEQLAVLSQGQIEKLEDWILAHVQKFFPKQFEARGEEKIKKTIQYGIQRSASYGITSKRDVCKYVDLAVVFGDDFDQESPWASAILGNEALKGPTAKMERLYKEVKKQEKEAKKQKKLEGAGHAGR